MNVTLLLNISDHTMSIFSLTSRLVQAQQASAPTKHQEEGYVKAGRSAEEELTTALRHHGVFSGHIFRCLRVPDGFQTRKFEIDLVVLTGRFSNSSATVASLTCSSQHETCMTHDSGSQF